MLSTGQINFDGVSIYSFFYNCGDFARNLLFAVHYKRARERDAYLMSTSIEFQYMQDGNYFGTLKYKLVERIAPPEKINKHSEMAKHM